MKKGRNWGGKAEVNGEKKGTGRKSRKKEGLGGEEERV